MAGRSLNIQAQGAKTPDARGQAVLSAIIKEHLVTGEPVGSRAISDRFAQAAGWSSATIRNVMKELDDAGFVEQPHTSAGRVPTDRGYRFYVDHMLGDTRLSKSDLAAIHRLLGGAEANVTPERLMEKISQALSALSQNVGIVVSPSLAGNRLQHIEFMGLADNRILVILVSAPHLIYDKVIRLDESLSQEDLERAARYLNTEFAGKSLSEIRAEVVELMRAEKALYDKLLRHAVMLCERSLEGEDAAGGEVYVDGASNILAQPDFTDAARMRDLFRTFEEKSRLVKILNECVARGPAHAGEVRVVIGREHHAPSMQNCALITAPYRLGAGEAGGTLGVVGPVRIEYPRMVAVVNYTARLVESLLGEEGAAHG